MILSSIVHPCKMKEENFSFTAMIDKDFQLLQLSILITCVQNSVLVLFSINMCRLYLGVVEAQWPHGWYTQLQIEWSGFEPGKDIVLCS